MELIGIVIDYIRSHFGAMSIYCLLPESAKEEIALINDLGFISQNQYCIDTEILARYGYNKTSGHIEVFRFKFSDFQNTNLQPFTNPLNQLSSNKDNFRIFSNSQTKVRLQPTLNFWQPIQLYTTYSAYPLISYFLEQLIKKFQIKAPERLMIAPCGSGYFLRFFPQNISCPLADGLDIQQGLINIAKIRVKSPAIDLLNLILCETLNKVVNNNELDEPSLQELKILSDKIITKIHSGRILEYTNQESLRLISSNFRRDSAKQGYS